VRGMPSDREQVQTEVRTERPVEGVTVVGLVGEHDLATKDEISGAIEQALAAGDSVAVDLSSAEFIDSSTLHVLVSSSRRAAESGRGFALVLGGNEAIRQVFELTGLVSQFESAPSVDQAVEALRAQAAARRSDSARPSAG
jgi:anti-sigma B factor antagonist